MVVTPQQLADVVKQVNAEFKVLEARIAKLEAAPKGTNSRKTVNKA